MTRYLKFHEEPSFDELHNISSGGLTPSQVCTAYGLAKVTPVRPIKIGIVSLGGYYSASDMETAFAGYQLPAPVVTTAGTQGTDQFATVENMLDIECLAAAYAYSTGQSATILQQYDQWNLEGLASAINALVAAGCEVISISWGWSASQQSASAIAARAKACAAAAAANCHIFASSGDYSLYDAQEELTTEDPCCDPNVWGVGGTKLELNPDGSIARESIWGDGSGHDMGGGGGFARDIPIPLYQQGVVPGAFRGCPDSSANADPATGFAIYALGKWQVMGGTSAAAPFTAGYVAAILSTLPGPISQLRMQELLYQNYRTAFNDIAIGSNGSPAKSGWDQASGCGSINGRGMFEVLTQ